MGQLYRCVGEVLYDTQFDPSTGQPSKVSLSQSSQTWSFLQCLHPLSPGQPAFSVQVKALGPQSRIVVGIAGTAIEENKAPGHWNNSVGYHSDTGRCYSSHDGTANTGGEVFGLGDRFSVVVSYFGKKLSTVIFYKNDIPVATRYLFEPDHQQFFPCLYLEQGPIELEVTWLESAVKKQTITGTQADVTHWIQSAGVKYDDQNKVFSYDKQETEAFLQDTVPLGPDVPFYDVTVEECSSEGVGPTVAIATSSPLKPTPPCVLLRDYLKWEPLKNSVRSGDHIGWGVHHSPERRERPDFDPRAEQIVLCYVLKNQLMQCFQMMLQPAGGFYPMVLLNQNASKVTVQQGNTVEESLLKELDKIYTDLLGDIRDMLETDAVNQRLTLPMLRLSEALEVDISSENCQVTLPKSARGIHAIQFLHPLSKDSSYFYIEINKLSGQSSVSVGVAGPVMSLSQSPGAVPASVGLSSQQGRLLSDNQPSGNMDGEKFSEGDRIGVQVSFFAESVAVVMFFKNERPIGTRYLKQADRNRYLPTVSLCANGQEVDVNIVWQTRVERGPLLNPVNLEHWCLPEGSVVDQNNVLTVTPNNKRAQVLQSSSSLNPGFNHYEIKLVDPFDDVSPPPVIALCAASPRDPPSSSPYAQDFIRFWATGKAATSVEQGDVIGWGILFPDDKSIKRRRSENLVICYLTVNRTVVLRRVLVLPPGGFYPVVILPAGVSRVKFEFAACCIEENPLSMEEVQQLMEEAERDLDGEAGLAGWAQQLVTNEQKSSPKPALQTQHRRAQSASYSLNSEGLSDEERRGHRKGSLPSLDLPSGKKIGKDKNKEKKQKKSRKKESVGKSTEKKLKRSSKREYDEEAIADQYQSKSCVIL